jgi:hypothetical protein
VLFNEITHLFIVGSGARFKWYVFDSCPLATACFATVVATQVACGIPTHVYNYRIMISIACSAVIKVRVYIVVPGTF